MRLLIATVLLVSTTACTWVPIEASGKAVRVIAAGAAPAAPAFAPALPLRPAPALPPGAGQ